MGESVSRAWLVPCFMLWTGCSGDSVPSGFLDDKSEPVLLVRCQEGRITAYITLDPPDDREGGPVPDGAVPIHLDSTPSC
jgi:hypothetical protein